MRIERIKNTGTKKKKEGKEKKHIMWLPTSFSQQVSTNLITLHCL